jgi:secreted trypsin-like serine protease
MNSGVFILVWVSLFSLLIACAPKSGSDSNSNANPVPKSVADLKCEAFGDRAAGVIGGQEVSSDSKVAQSTVFLVNGDLTKGEVDLCSGTLIDQNLILTAAHCVPENESPAELHVILSLNPKATYRQSGAQALRNIDRIIRNKQFAHNPGSHNDLALVRLSEPVPCFYRAIALLKHPIQLNSESMIYVSGFGKTTDYNESQSWDPILRMAQVRPLLQSSDVGEITQSTERAVLYFDQSQGQGACAGDSGGPTMLSYGNSLYLIGVNSAVEAERDSDPVTCRAKLRSVSVFSQIHWIESNYNLLINQGSYGNQFRR